jgi:D-glycero-D-manno-heptose 1,7-bisphosphate phosphatase
VLEVHSRVYRRPVKGLAAAVFVDRDGVIVDDVGYLHRVEDIHLIPGAAEAIAALNRAGMPVIEVTNQAGVARGYYGWPEYETVQSAIEAYLAQAGASIDAVWACGCHPDGTGPLAIEHPCRKPNPGMLLAAAEELNLDLSTSWMVGDKLLDLEAGLRAGCRGAVLVATGYGQKWRAEAAQRAATDARIRFAASLREAVAVVTG